MAESFLINNEGHYNGLMTDWGSTLFVRNTHPTT